MFILAVCSYCIGQLEGLCGPSLLRRWCCGDNLSGIGFVCFGWLAECSFLRVLFVVDGVCCCVIVY
jgi:hypothetical protein